MDHDITFTPEAEHDAEDCCHGDNNEMENCFAISIPRDDPFYGPKGQVRQNYGTMTVKCIKYYKILLNVTEVHGVL